MEILINIDDIAKEIIKSLPMDYFFNPANDTEKIINNILFQVVFQARHQIESKQKVKTVVMNRDYVIRNLMDAVSDFKHELKKLDIHIYDDSAFTGIYNVTVTWVDEE